MRNCFDNALLNLLLYAYPQTEIQISVHKQKGTVAIHFKGTGTPVEKKEIKNLFSDYHHGTAFSSHTEATGLGLFLCKQIAELHNGEITANVKKNDITYILTFPV